MRMNVVAIFVIAPIFAQTGHPTSPITTGTIEGNVLSADNIPVDNASVYAVPEKGLRTGLRFPVRTDKSGRFRIENVKVGRSVIYVSKPEAGYLEPSFAFYSGNQPSAVADVIPDGITSVDIRLGPKCAYLVGSVRNSEDGAPVTGANFRFSRADDPNIWLSIAPLDESGHFRTGVPSDTRFQLRVVAEHFKPWQLGIDQSQTLKDGLSLKPDEEYTIDIQLQAISPIKNRNSNMVGQGPTWEFRYQRYAVNQRLRSAAFTRFLFACCSSPERVPHQSI